MFCVSSEVFHWHCKSFKKFINILHSRTCKELKSEENILKNKIGEGSYIFPFREFLLLEIDFKVSANTFSESDLFKQNYYAKVRLIPVT